MNSFLRTSLVGLSLALAAAMPAHATILTFDSDVTNPNGIYTLQQSYGDNVNGPLIGNAAYGVGTEGYTPDVAVSYYTTDLSGNPLDPSALTRWTTDFGDLVNVFENEYDASELTYITFTAAAGHTVNLYGFDMAGWPNTDRTIANLSIFDNGGNSLFSINNTLIEGANDGGPRHNTFSFATPLSSASLTIRLDTQLGGDNDTVGFDNIRFGQDLPVVDPSPAPEPASWAMMIGGFGLVGAALRRRRAATVRFA